MTRKLRIEMCLCPKEDCDSVYVVSDLDENIAYCRIDLAPMICKALSTQYPSDFSYKEH